MNHLDLQSALERETGKRIARHQAQMRQRSFARLAFERETGESAILRPARPRLWDVLPAFDPYRVRARVRTIARGVANSIAEGRYHVAPAFVVPGPKDNDSTRVTYRLSVPDAAVAYAFSVELEKRYGDKLNSGVFGYRRGRGSAAALRHVTPAVRSMDHRWAVRTDFTAFFASLGHENLLRVARERFRMEPADLRLIEEFLRMPRAFNVDAFVGGDFKMPTVGLVEGSTLSLILSLIATTELDCRLGAYNCVYAAAGDDRLVLVSKREAARDVLRLIREEAARIGVALNAKKSGIIDLRAVARGAAPPLVFLGHSFRGSDVDLSPARIARMKRKVSSLLHRTLLLDAARAKTHPAGRPRSMSSALVRCLHLLRLFVEGRRRRRDPIAPGRRYVPLGLPCPRSLTRLDGWLIDVLARALRARKRALAVRNVGTKTQLVRALRTSGKVPSFVRTWEKSTRRDRARTPPHPPRLQPPEPFPASPTGPALEEVGTRSSSGHGRQVGEPVRQ